MGSDEVNGIEDRTEPKQLVGKAGVRTAAVDACNPGVANDQRTNSELDSKR